MEILKHLHRNQIIRFSLKAIRRKTGLLSGDDKPTIIILPEKGSGCLIIINKVPTIVPFTKRVSPKQETHN